MHNGNWVHPEVRKEVIKEFNLMRQRHPEMSGNALWEMSRDYVWTMALTETAIFRCGMAL